MRDFNALTEVTGTRRLDPLFPGSPFSTKLNFTKFTFSPLNTHVFKGKKVNVFKGEKVNLVKFNFVEKGGVNREKEVQTSSACDRSYHVLYNNTLSKAIVNAASNITYRPLIEADDRGR